jgi:hypothetical protein
VTQPRRRRSVEKRDVREVLGTANVNVLGQWPTAVTSQAPAAKRREPRQLARAEATAGGRLPIQAVIDRHGLLEPFTVEVTLLNPQDGKTVEAIRRVPEAAGVLGTWGADVNDPAGFSSRVNPRLAICHILAPRAAAQCFAGRGA